MGLNLAAIEVGHPLAPIAEPVIAALSAKAFPCTFAGTALARGALRIAHVDLDDPDHTARTFHTISNYLHDVRYTAEQSPRAAALMALLLDVQVPAGSTFERLREQAWALLVRLHAHDHGLGNAWPREIPHDMSDPRWSYCLEQTPLFVNVTSSTLVLRRSRNLGRRMLMVIQPSDGLHYVAPLNEQGDRIRETIRGRLDRFDGVPRSPALANSGEVSNLDWSQFFLEDSNAPSSWHPPQIPASVAYPAEGA